MKRLSRILVAYLWCLLWLCLAPKALGQVALDSNLLSSTVVSQSDVERQLAALENNTQISASERERLKAHYTTILENLAKRASYEAQADEYRDLQQHADEAVETITNKLTNRQQRSAVALIDTGLSTTELQALLAQKTLALDAAQEKRQSIDAALNGPVNTVSSIRQRLSDIRAERENLSKELAQLEANVSSGQQHKVTVWSLQSEVGLLAEEANMLELKLSSAPMKARLLVAEKALQQDIENALSQEVERLQEMLSQRRTEEAQASLETAQTLSESGQALSEQVAAYVDKNKRLSLELAQLAGDLNRTTERSQLAKEQLNYVNNRYHTIRQKLEIVGLSEALGQLLADRKDDLPQIASYRQERDLLLDAITEASLRKLEIQGELSYQYQLAEDKTALLQSLPVEAQAARADFIDQIVANRLSLLKKLEADNSVYMRVLSDVDYDLIELIKVTDQFDEFLVRKLMWVRTSSPLYAYSFDNIASELSAFLAYYRDMSYSAALLDALPSFGGWLLLLLAAGLAVAKRWLLQQQTLAMTQMFQRSHASLTPALKYLVLVALQALPLTLLAFVMTRMVDVAVIPKAHASLVGSLWLYLFCADFIARLLRTDGFVQRYFRWPNEVLGDLRCCFKRLRNLVVLPLLVITVIPWHLFASKGSGFLGGLVICVSICSLAYSLSSFISRKYALVASIKHRRLVRPASRLQVMVSVILVGGPIIWALSLLLGYRYASIVLAGRVFETVLVFPFITLFYLVAERGLMEFQTRVKLNRKQLEAQASKAAEQESPLAEEGSGPVVVDDDRTRSLDELAEETQKLLKSVFLVVTLFVMGVIWSTVLPALAIFDEVTLWNISTVIDGSDVVKPFTLSSLLFLLVGGAVAYIVVRRLPAFVEMVLLSRINMGNGSRYAITTLMSYALLGIAVSYIGHAIGFGWSKIQWAVAALSVGIGFGLQEIVANFISGIIILFERPIRVGDLVTINGQTGVVHRIQIRATTLRDFDNKELLVPNKEFITSSLLNWTLSDKEVRILLPVGIAYGSDVDLALELLEQAAVEHPEVLEEPAPMVTFESFGDNALSLYLRCRIASVDDRLQIVTELHKAINAKYNAAGIAIAFPQRDLHVDFAAPLEVVLKKPAPKASA
ncbi:MAG TPA: mechanosensitive ion channel domain-containing protein [Marinagarivorans sp.]